MDDLFEKYLLAIVITVGLLFGASVSMTVVSFERLERKLIEQREVLEMIQHNLRDIDRERRDEYYKQLQFVLDECP